ncbi:MULTISPECIES: aminopeptidase [unclassified Microbulbifer]|uniref:aminopeptidase n=1 Tax=unclassified Microbulbifer TaxID=2619833 RepID=UPI0027E43AE7|nr:MULTISPECIES: aminopeptidase [unclassified Microbulbifer]
MYSSYRRLPRGRTICLLLIAVLLSGCETAGYYTQAVTGQWRLLAARKPIETVAAAPGTGEELRERLRLVQDIRAYAGAELQLPVGKAYGSYVKLAEDFPVWNVLAAPEFSLSPKRWCYPFIGCASYRGYFRKADAEAKAKALLAEGYDIYLGPVPAYSTLGWFDDPVLSSFVNWPPDRLAGLLFHELAHRRVYISGDTTFNESFATAVSELALPDWRRRQGLNGRTADRRAQSMAIRRLMMAARKQLEPIYKSPLADEEKRARKAEVLERLRYCYDRMSADWPNAERYRAYIEKTNNATLALASEYQSLVPAFAQLYRESGETWPAFYQAVERLGKEDKKTRDRRLKALAARHQESSDHVSSKKVTGPSFDSETCMSAANIPVSTGEN